MTYTITLCDTSFNDVMDTGIQFEAVSSGGTIYFTASNASLKSGWGAILTFASSHTRFDIEIDTSRTKYAPLVIENLNGDRNPQTIDVILLSLPAAAPVGPKSNHHSADPPICPPATLV